mgnify:CR=1 FL=1
MTVTGRWPSASAAWGWWRRHVSSPFSVTLTWPSSLPPAPASSTTSLIPGTAFCEATLLCSLILLPSSDWTGSPPPMSGRYSSWSRSIDLSFFLSFFLSFSWQPFPLNNCTHHDLSLSLSLSLFSPFLQPSGRYHSATPESKPTRPCTWSAALGLPELPPAAIPAYASCESPLALTSIEFFDLTKFCGNLRERDERDSRWRSLKQLWRIKSHCCHITAPHFFDSMILRFQNPMMTRLVYLVFPS